MLEKVKMIIMIILSITICVGITVQAEEIGSMQASDQDVWTGIVLPKKYRLEYENIGNFLLDAERYSEEVQKSLLKHTAWKPGVQLFRTTGLSRYDLLGRLGEKIVPITQESIGYFVEKIDSEAKAIELAIFFHEGILLRQEADVQALIQACRTSNVAKVNNTI